MKKFLYRILLSKQESEDPLTFVDQVGIVMADSSFEAEEKAREEAKKTWEPQGYVFQGVFYEEKSILEQGHVIWL